MKGQFSTWIKKNSQGNTQLFLLKFIHVFKSTVHKNIQCIRVHKYIHENKLQLI